MPQKADISYGVDISVFSNFCPLFTKKPTKTTIHRIELPKKEI